MAADLGSRAAAIDGARVGAEVEIGDRLVVGSAVVHPLEGCEARVLRAGERRCGLLLEGPSQLVYTVSDPFSVPVARRNLDRAADLRWSSDDGVLSIHERLDGVAVWSLEPDEVAAAEASPERARPLPGWVREILDRPLFARPSLDLLEAELAGARGVAFVLFRGASERLLLRVDPELQRLETLSLLDRVGMGSAVDGGRHVARVLVSQPVSRPWWERTPAPLVATHEDLDVVNRAESHVVVRSRTVLQPARNGVGGWRVALADRTLDRRSVHPVQVRSVRVRGRPARYLHQDGELLVDISPAPASTGQVAVEVLSEGRLALRPNDDSFWSLGTWPWHPLPPRNGQLATVNLRVDIPEGFVPFASGATTSRTTANGRTVLETRLGSMSQRPVVAAGAYRLIEEERGGVRCTVAAYVFGKEAASRRLLENFFAAAEVYERILGHPYPLAEMNIVEINSWGFGQAPPGVIFITREAFDPIGGTTSQLFSEGVNERFVHEVAHSWWGHLVKADGPEEQWLEESLAQYSAALCLQAAAGGGRKGQRQFDRLLNHWKGETALIGDGGSLYLASWLAMDDDRDRADRSRLLYAKGPLVLHALRRELGRRAGSEALGDRHFFTMLRALIRNFTYRWTGTAHVVGILDQITGSSWQPWFERYVYGCEVPAVR